MAGRGSSASFNDTGPPTAKFYSRNGARNVSNASSTQRLRYEARQAKTLEWVRSFVAHLSSWRLPLNATDLHQGIIFAC